MSADKLVLGLAGMPGSGKSVAVNIAKRNGYYILTMGDVVREEARKRNLKPSPENLGKIMLDLRQKEGNSVIARRCLPRLEKTRIRKILIDGTRSLDEVEEFKKHFPKFTLIAVHSSPDIRFRRLHHRQRSDDPDNWIIFHQRDMRELSVGLGDAIAMAEYVIVNEGKLEIVKGKILQVLRRVERKWIKREFT